MRRTLWMAAFLGSVSVVAVGTWIAAAQVLRSPAQVAAEADPPEPSAITAPVERRVLATDVVVRGTVEFSEPVEVSLRGRPAADGDLVVTAVPEPGDEVAEGDVLLQVSGRPVFALAGALPPYRDLRPGATGDDVAQLQQALHRLGLDAGGVDGAYGPRTASAVAALYGAGGFEPPGAAPEDEERLRQAEERRSSARQQVQQAEEQLRRAREGPSRIEVLQAEAAVGEARDRREAAEPGTTEERRAAEQLVIAEARLEELQADPDTSPEQQALASARQERDRAEAQLADLRAAAGAWLPAGEVVFFGELPQQVDEVAATVGGDASGTLLTVTSGEVVVSSSVPADDVGLIAEGDEVAVDDEGSEVRFTAVIDAVAARPGTGGAGEGRHGVALVPAEDAGALMGRSLRVRIPVESTDGEVLAVPLAALSAAADGSSRVEVAGDGGSTRVVGVRPGLSAGGMVEVTPLDGHLAEGDQVVVGR